MSKPDLTELMSGTYWCSLKGRHFSVSGKRVSCNLMDSGDFSCQSAWRKGSSQCEAYERALEDAKSKSLGIRLRNLMGEHLGSPYFRPLFQA